MKNGDGAEELKKRKTNLKPAAPAAERCADACTAAEVDTLQRLEKKHGI